MTINECVDKIINYPANENSDPDVMACAITEIRELAEQIKAELAQQRVWLLHISHRHGDDTTVHATEKDALDTLDRYCRDWWHEVAEEGEPYPETNGIDRYFELHEFDESYSVVQTPIQNQPKET